MPNCSNTDHIYTQIANINYIPALSNHLIQFDTNNLK